MNTVQNRKKIIIVFSQNCNVAKDREIVVTRTTIELVIIKSTVKHKTVRRKHMIDRGCATHHVPEDYTKSRDTHGESDNREKGPETQNNPLTISAWIAFQSKLRRSLTTLLQGLLHFTFFLWRQLQWEQAVYTTVEDCHETVRKESNSRSTWMNLSTLYISQKNQKQSIDVHLQSPLLVSKYSSVWQWWNGVALNIPVQCHKNDK